MSNTVLCHGTPASNSPGRARLLRTSPETPQILPLLPAPAPPRLPTSMKGSSTSPLLGPMISESFPTVLCLTPHVWSACDPAGSAFERSPEAQGAATSIPLRYVTLGLPVSPREKTQNLMKTDAAPRGRDLHSPLTSRPSLSSLICTCHFPPTLSRLRPPPGLHRGCLKHPTLGVQFPQVFLSKCHFIDA